MEEGTNFAVFQFDELVWPESIKIPTSRFRLLVAADTQEISTDVISRFGEAALRRGMTYLCAWGPGCERFHDIVDEIIAMDDISHRRFAGPHPNDTIMTTWQTNESLEEALWFFVMCALPTVGFIDDSDYWLVINAG